MSVYALVSYKSAVQAEATTPGLTGNFSEVAKMLVKVSSEAQRSGGRGDSREATDRKAAERAAREMSRATASANHAQVKPSRQHADMTR